MIRNVADCGERIGMSKSGGVGSPLAIATMFFGNGFAIASTFSRMPGIRDQLGCSPDQLAFALVCMGIGSVVGMPFAGRFVERYSSGTVSLVVTVIFLSSYAALPLSRSLFVFGTTLLIAGVGAGVGDVAMNVQGHLVEARRGKVLMPYWHGSFSIGAVFGALFGWLSAATGLPLSWQLPTVSAVLMVVMGFATTHYLREGILDSSLERETVVHGPQTLPVSGSTRRQERRLRFEPIIIVLGIVILATAVGEGVANDWLALVLVDDRGAAPAVGALTYGGFNLTMAIGRFTGGSAIQRFGRVPVLRSAGTLACAGITALCLVNSTFIALLGAFAWGLGLSVVFPAVISAAGEIPGRGVAAIAQVATIGYAGFLIAAPLIGLLAHWMPLDRALLAIAPIALLITLLASAAKERSHEPVK
jgi:predicted MFS family arabinose efflux permease